MAQRCAVIGGGPAGCAAAYQLSHSGFETVLFEKAPQVGGRTTTWRDAARGITLDTGAGFFTNFYPVLTSLLARLGLGHEVIEIARVSTMRWGEREARLSTSPLSFLQFPFLTVGERLRMARYTTYATLRYRGLDMSRAASMASADDASVETFVRTRLGDALYNQVVRPGIEPFWYFSCADVSRALFCALLARAATARFFTLRSGMDTLCQRLSALVECRTNTPVERLVRDGQGITVVPHEGAAQRFDCAVIATPASTAHALTAQLGDDTVAPQMRAFLQSQHYVPNIHAAFVAPLGRRPPGVSTVFPCGPGVSPVAAISFNNQKNQGSPAQAEIISVFLGALQSAKLLDTPREAISEQAWALARAFYPSLPAQADPLTLEVRREAIPVHGVGRYRQAAHCLAMQKAPLLFAGDCLATATVDGALATGMHAAANLGATHFNASRFAAPVRKSA